MWSCGVCTYSNSLAHPFCDICGAERINFDNIKSSSNDNDKDTNSGSRSDGGSAIAAEAEGQNEIEFLQTIDNMWSCGVCTYSNSFARPFCDICGTERMNHENIKSNDDNNNNNNTSGVERGLCSKNGSDVKKRLLELFNSLGEEETVDLLQKVIEKKISTDDKTQAKIEILPEYDEDTQQAIVKSLAEYKEMELSSLVTDGAIAESINHHEFILASQSFADYAVVHCWACRSCQIENDAMRHDCMGCGEPKEREWMCSSCTFDNQSFDSHCIMCGTAFTDTANILYENPVVNSTNCCLPGCVKPAVYFGYCSKDHKHRAITQNMLPPTEAGVERILVGPSGDFTAHLLNRDSPKHSSVKTQFLSTWLKNDDGNPRIERIYWICVKPEIRDRFATAVRVLGNVGRRFHGTSQDSACLFGSDQSATPCDGSSCNVCSIAQHSFDRKKAKTKVGSSVMQLRYGEGLYFSPVSSKSNDYNQGSERARYDNITHKQRSVVIGNPFITQEGSLPPEQCPPTGYDSVIGETGKSLNYDEVVVYNKDHAIPQYLIVYSLH